MNATQEQLKLKLTQALVAAFGTDYTNTDRSEEHTSELPVTL